MTIRLTQYHFSNLKLRTGREYKEFGFDRAYFDTLTAFMGTSLPEIGADADAFINGHFNLVYGFLQALQHEENQVSIKTENRELEKNKEIGWRLS